MGAIESVCVNIHAREIDSIQYRNRFSPTEGKKKTEADDIELQRVVVVSMSLRGTESRWKGKKKKKKTKPDKSCAIHILTKRHAYV